MTKLAPLGAVEITRSMASDNAFLICPNLLLHLDMPQQITPFGIQRILTKNAGHTVDSTDVSTSDVTGLRSKLNTDLSATDTQRGHVYTSSINQLHGRYL
jgi:hypothetical protein